MTKKKEKEKTKAILVRNLTLEQHKRLRFMALEKDMSMSDFIMWLIKVYAEKNK